MAVSGIPALHAHSGTSSGISVTVLHSTFLPPFEAATWSTQLVTPYQPLGTCGSIVWHSTVAPDALIGAAAQVVALAKAGLVVWHVVVMVPTVPALQVPVLIQLAAGKAAQVMVGPPTGSKAVQLVTNVVTGARF